MEHHTLMGGKLHIYKRPNSSYWQCSTYLAGKNRRMSTKEDSLTRAKDIAEDWYLELRGKQRAGQIKDGKTFRVAADQFLREYPVLTQGQRNAKYVSGHSDRLRVYCKSTSGAVRPYLRLRKRNNPLPTDRLFPGNHRVLFNNILDELGLKTDRDGNRRTAYSLRHTYICLRLLEGADIYQIAKNCRTSVEMIEKYYAVHLKNSLDASAINVRRSRTQHRKSRRA